MYCPFCSSNETKVVDSRLVAGGSQIKRRRECLKCSNRFNTYEINLDQFSKYDTKELYDLIMGTIKIPNGEPSELWVAFMYKGEIKGGVAKKEAEEFKKKLEAAGAKVELK